MKNLLLILLILISGSLIAQNDCEYPFFSEYVEGTHNNKALEIYNPTWQAITLTSEYRIIRWSNGSATSDADIRYVQPLTGTIPAYGTYTAFLDRRDPSASGLDTMLFQELLTIANSTNGGFYSPDYNSGTQGARCLAFNGDDAFSIQKNISGNWVDLDFIGVKGEQPVNGNGTTSPNGAWTAVPQYWDGQGTYWTKNKTMIRKPGVRVGVMNSGVPYSSPGAFNPSVQWDTTAVNSFDSLGAHTCTCAITGIKDVNAEANILLFPNPVTENDFTVQSSQGIHLIQIYNLNGQLIKELEYETRPVEVIIDVAELSPGVYNLSIGLQGGAKISRTLSLQ